MYKQSLFNAIILRNRLLNNNQLDSCISRMQVAAYASNCTDSPPQFPVFGRAAGVCHQCRRSKARCDKFLPACTRCASKQMRCVYGRQLSAGGVCTDDGEGVIPPTNRQMACIFEVSLETCYKLVSMISVALLSGIDDAEQDASILRMALKPTGLTAASIAQAYRERVHGWFPIVSDDQITSFATSSILGNCHSRDGVLLFCMALVSQPPCAHPGHDVCCNLYKAAKQSFLLLQTSSTAYLQTLQIGLLLSLFEYGHGLDQESRLSIAACATICKLHKLPSLVGNKDEDGLTVTNICLKAIEIMDCLIELSNESTNIQVSTNNGFLPMIEHTWPDDHILGESGRSLSNFETLFRVASIIREALQYLKTDATVQPPNSSYITIESRLRNVCFTLIQAAGPNSLVFCDSIALALSFLFEFNLLQTKQSQAAISTADRLAIESSRRMAVDICKSMSETVLRKGVEGLSLIGLSSTCRAANLLAKTNADLQEEGMFTRSDLEQLNSALGEFAQRWRIGVER
ncbi:hypothetical protein ACQKWADRAFT_292689 [Trichoderma austrokoningii]